MSHRCKDKRKCQPPLKKKDKLIFCKPVIAFCKQTRSFVDGNGK